MTDTPTFRQNRNLQVTTSNCCVQFNNSFLIAVIMLAVVFFEWQQWCFQEHRPSMDGGFVELKLVYFYCPKKMIWFIVAQVNLNSISWKKHTARCPQAKPRYCMLHGQIACFSFAWFKNHDTSRAKIVQLQLGHLQDFTDTQNGD